MPRCVVIIPSRYASSRFPGKPLVPIAGKPMIQHVYERARQARLVEAVIVATDDQRILAAVEACGGQAVLTSPTHPTGTRQSIRATDTVGETFEVAASVVSTNGVPIAVERTTFGPTGAQGGKAVPAAALA